MSCTTPIRVTQLMEGSRCPGRCALSPAAVADDDDDDDDDAAAVPLLLPLAVLHARVLARATTEKELVRMVAHRCTPFGPAHWTEGLSANGVAINEKRRSIILESTEKHKKGVNRKKKKDVKTTIYNV